MGIFVIVQKSNGSFQFSLRAGNGRAVLISPEHTSRTHCEVSIETVREHAIDDGNFILMTTPKGDFYFQLETSKGKVLGSSDMHKSRIACHQDVLAVKTFAKVAIVDTYYADTDLSSTK